MIDNDEPSDQVSTVPVPDETIEGYEQPTVGGWEGYPLDELAIRDERRSAMDVSRRIDQGRFILDPDFQRDFVWDIDKQSRLIESILLRLPLPVFYVAEDNEGRLIVVDGLQRLTTLQNFFSGKLKLRLPDRPELNKNTFKALEPRLQNRVEDCQLHFYIIDHAVPEKARLDIFERVNGGEVLTRQQMRNAIFNGPATTFLKQEASSPLFLSATGGSLNTKKMQDREFVNRFCSFRMFGVEEYRDMDEWLAKSLQAINRSAKQDHKQVPYGIEELQQLLRKTLSINYELFGKHAFRKHNPHSIHRGLINASLFDVMSTGLSRYENDHVLARKEQLRDGFFQLMDNEVFIRSITYSPNTPNVVRKRFQIANDMFREVLGG